MSKKGYTAEQIINRLREAEVLLSQGQTTAAACRQLGITDQTYYRWRKQYGGMKVGQARRLKELETENSRCAIHLRVYRLGRHQEHNSQQVWRPV